MHSRVICLQQCRAAWQYTLASYYLDYYHWYHIIVTLTCSAR